MESLYSNFAQVLDRYHQPNTKIVLAFSGGVDSRLLLELLSRYQQAHSVDNQSAGSKSVRCHAVYVHHGLSVNADDWAQKCKQWAQQAGSHVPLNT